MRLAPCFVPLTLALAVNLAFAAPARLAPAQTGKTIASVEFTATPAPATDAERASVFTQSQAVVHYRDGSEQAFPLTYQRLFATTDTFNGRAAGQIGDQHGQPLRDAQGQLLISDAPDANSLLQPLRNGKAGKGAPLYLITHYEYATSDSAGKEGFWARLPGGMSLARLSQNQRDGSLQVQDVRPIDFKGVGGLWVPCAGSLSPWNTHLGSEEYEPDARCVGEPDYVYPTSGKAACGSAPNSLEAMHKYGLAQVNPYDYGLTPEVTVSADGRTRVVKHRALGRQSREKAQVMPDLRTVFQGDDGTYNVLTMFVADRAKDLSAGTLYAAKWQQTSDQNGGTATLSWLRLGHGSDRAIARQAKRLRFADIFVTAPVVVNKDAQGKLLGYAPPPAGFKQIISGHNNVNVENLQLKPGMEQAAAFLETRRYAAYLGATTEFDKYEGVALNAKDHKVYHAITQIAGGMTDNRTDPQNDVRLPANVCGAVYEMSTGGGQRDQHGKAIASAWVGTAMRAAVIGQPQDSDAIGDTCAIDGISRPDNLSYSEKMRVLFIGEDSSRHLNNFLWALHLDSGKLVRVLSLPAGAEATGLQVVDDNRGFAYVMANYQHAAEFTYPFESWNVTKANPDLATRLGRLIDRKQGGVGYLGGLPKLR